MMNQKFKQHEPKKLAVHPIVGLVMKTKKTKVVRENAFAPLLNRKEKEYVKHLSQHERVVFLRVIRLGITSAEYKLRCASGF